jgi:hypothetical protein
MSGFAVLKASTICASASESGGRWLVQNLTTAASDLQAAPVMGVGSALAPAAVDALAAAEAGAVEAGGVLAPGALLVEGLPVVELHAAMTTAIDTTNTDQRDRLGTEIMAPPLLFQIVALPHAWQRPRRGEAPIPGFPASYNERGGAHSPSSGAAVGPAWRRTTSSRLIVHCRPRVKVQGSYVCSG